MFQDLEYLNSNCFDIASATTSSEVETIFLRQFTTIRVRGHVRAIFAGGREDSSLQSATSNWFVSLEHGCVREMDYVRL